MSLSDKDIENLREDDLISYTSENVSTYGEVYFGKFKSACKDGSSYRIYAIWELDAGSGVFVTGGFMYANRVTLVSKQRPYNKLTKFATFMQEKGL